MSGDALRQYTRINITLPPGHLAALDAEAARLAVPRSTLLARLIERAGLVGDHPSLAPDPRQLTLTGVVEPEVQAEVAGKPTMRAAPGIPCSHAPSIRTKTASGMLVCGDCGWVSTNRGETWRQRS